MRLLHTKSYRLKEFLGPEFPEYAILSHTWGEEEILYSDVVRDNVATSAIQNPGDAPMILEPSQPSWSQKHGGPKVLRSAQLALEKGYDYIWIDTCCIDKSSSAELSEAINSMFKWYSSAKECFAYLVDYKLSSAGSSFEYLEKSRWFQRGWTLQELIAPSSVLFFDQHWNFVGTRLSLCHQLHEITSIPPSVLERESDSDMYRWHYLRSHSVSNKMKWAIGRRTTREEDMAYCLLGIFNVNMPLLYGEGSKAFTRLLKKIVKEGGDQTLLCWDRRSTAQFLPKSPEAYATKLDIVGYHSSEDQFSHLQKHGMRFADNTMSLEVYLCSVLGDRNDMPSYVAILDCSVRNDCEGLTRAAIWLYEHAPRRFIFSYPSTVYVVRPTDPRYAVAVPDFHGASDSVPLPIDLTEISERVTIEIDDQRHHFSPGGMHGFSRPYGAMLFHRIEGNAPGLYQWGPSKPPHSDTTMIELNSTFGIEYPDKRSIVAVVVVAHVLDGRTTYPCMVVCFGDKPHSAKKRKPIVPLLTTDSNVMNEVFSCERWGNTDRFEESLRASNYQTEELNSTCIALGNGDFATVWIEESEFLGSLIYDLVLRISG
ncbi:heterokaryon incompatibility protein-domain-containing protein [Xylariaceae sp. FL1272]|nr:heterokaryon incompatibility protein-domain-containing protein [Xylariaceae sp. FL1272]